MARIEKSSVFRTEPKSSGFSKFGEPWRTFKSSLAIRFSSKLQRPWNPENLNVEMRSQIVRAIEARQLLTAAYMEFHTAVRELVVAASAFPRFRLDSPAFTHPDSEVRKAAIRIALEAGPLATQRQELAKLFERFEDVAGDLDLLVNGFLNVREGRSHEISMTFSLDRQITLGSIEVEREARRLHHFLRKASGLLIAASEKLVEAPAG